MKNNPRARHLRRVKAEVRSALGGKCALCKQRHNLEVDHIDGCTWIQRNLNQEHRWYRYRRELLAGIRLRLLCRKHNAARNQSVHGSIQDRIAPISVPEIEVGQVYLVCRYSKLQTNPSDLKIGDKFLIRNGSQYDPHLREWMIEIQLFSLERQLWRLPYTWMRACCKLRD